MNNRGLGKFTRVAATSALLALPLVTVACSLDTKSDVISMQERVELRQGSQTMRLPTASMNEAALADAADQYRRLGDGPVYVTVTYDPKSKTNTAMNATEEAARIATYLRRKGGAGVEISSDIIPVMKSGSSSDTLITYDVVTAHAPEGCEVLGGLDGTQTHVNTDYRYGCTMETKLSRQIASPKDLKGRAGVGSDTADGRRQANIINTYKKGDPNPALIGESSSQAP